MPVRIYEIAKDLNLESRLVLQKAKELGISAAKVPSSSLDKITAEYLREQLLPMAGQGGASTGHVAPTVATPPAQVAHEPINFVRPPPPPPVVEEEEFEEPVEPEVVVIERESHREPESPLGESPGHSAPVAQADHRSAVSAHTAEPVRPPTLTGQTAAPVAVPVPVAPITKDFTPPGLQTTDSHPSSANQESGQASSTVVQKAEREPVPLVPAPTAPTSSPAAAEAGRATHPAASAPTISPVKPAVSAPTTSAEVRPPASSAPPAPPAIAPGGRLGDSRPVAPTPPPAPPTPPAAPGRPGLGDKVGFINLGNLGRSAGRNDDRRSDNRGAARPPAPNTPQRPGTPQNQTRPGSPTGQNRPGNASGPGHSQGQGSSSGPSGGQRPPMNRPGDQRRDDRRPNQGPSSHGQSHPGQRGPAPAPQRPGPPKLDIAANAPTIIMRPPIVVRELAEKMGRRPFQVIADLMQMGVFATVTQTIDTEVAAKVSAKHGFRFETEKRDKAAHVVNVPKEQKVELDREDTEASLKPRPPVVTIMGHVDHGKTTLLDRIRKANVASGEAGGITQHIGAYTIAYPHPVTGVPTQLTFLDTPGHAAFSAMRARGANVTDIVILVVAANDGVMPQTLEALAHAKQARVPIIVAVNKSDHPAANGLKVRQQLQDKGLLPDDWGGDTLYVDCSGLTGLGMEKLIEAILLQAELLELRANPDRKAKGNVIESGVEPGGPVATVLVRKGTLNVGDVVICGEYYGKVRAMMNEEGQRLKVATPSTAVRVLGLNGVPDAGSEFSAIENEKSARDLAESRFEERKRAELEGVRPRRQTLEDLYSQMKDLTAKVLKVIVKADTQGSVEAICEALGKIETNKVQLDIIHSAVGAITEHDVLLASSGNAVVLGFHSRVDSTAAEAAKHEGVQIKLYAIIYELIDQVKEAMAGLLDPLLKEVVVGQAEVRKVFELSKGGKVAGCAVTSGRLVRGKLRVRRRGNLIYEGVSQTLKRFQDEVNEVKSGLECGIRLEGFDEFVEGDIIECYTTEKVTQKL